MPTTCSRTLHRSFQNVGDNLVFSPSTYVMYNNMQVVGTYLLWILNFHFAHTCITPHSEGWIEPVVCLFYLFSRLDSREYFQEIPTDYSMEVTFHQAEDREIVYISMRILPYPRANTIVNFSSLDHKIHIIIIIEHNTTSLMGILKLFEMTNCAFSQANFYESVNYLTN